MMLDRRLTFLLSGLFAGCTLINSVDDVKPQGAGGGGTGGTSADSGAGGSATGGGGSGGSDASVGGSGGSAGSGGASGSGGAATGGGGSGTGGSDSGSSVHPDPTKGLILLGGTDGTHGVLSVLQGAEAGDGGAVGGSELRRETLPTGAQVAGLAYDGAAGRDVWFVFLATDFPAAPDKVADLEVRYFDDATNKWSLVSKKTTLPPPQPGSFAVLNDRLAYLSYKIVGSVPVPSLTLLDTHTLTNVQQVTLDPLMLPADAKLVGLLGARGAIGDPTGLGGQLTVIYTTSCAATCQLQVLPITVGDSVIASVPKSIDTFVGTPAFASALIQQRNFYALPQPAGVNVHFVTNDPRSPDVLDPFTAPSFAAKLGSLTVDECSSVGLLTSVNEDALFGVTLGVHVGTNVPLGAPGQLVRWDPFSAKRTSSTMHRGTVVTAFNPKLAGTAAAPDGGPAPSISAFNVTSNGTTQVSITPLPSGEWAPPTDLYTNVMQVRFPVGRTCP